MNRKLFNIISYLFVALLLVTAVSFAGSLTPPGSPSKTMKSLSDLYELVNTGANTPSTDFTTPGAVSATMHSLGDTYDLLKTKITAIDATKILTNTTIFGVEGSAVSGGVPKTGQTTCYIANGSAQNPCLDKTQTDGGQDGYYQKGIAPAYVDNGNGTITDNSTGLIWQKQDDGVRRSWTDSLAYCNANTADLPGANWRMPNIKELFSIVDFKDNTYPTPAINTVFFSDTQSDGYYWSSTNYQTDGNQNYVWAVSSYDGKTQSYSKNYFLGHYVRCVR